MGTSLERFQIQLRTYALKRTMVVGVFRGNSDAFPMNFNSLRLCRLADLALVRSTKDSGIAVIRILAHTTVAMAWVKPPAVFRPTIPDLCRIILGHLGFGIT